MGQTASTIDASNPQPTDFTFETADELEVNIEKVNEAHTAPAVDSEEASAEDDRRDDVPKAQGRRSNGRIEEANPKAKQSRSKKSKEDEIDQEQAKQDLIAYLEIVGENASNLPLTWRDDPQLGRAVSTLTAKEYAKKADAFIPCDIRIIGATSVNYDRTADVPIKGVSISICVKFGRNYSHLLICPLTTCLVFVYSRA